MLMQFNWLDYCFIGLISFSTLMGFVRGLVQELSFIASLGLGLWSSIIFHESMAAQLPDMIQPIEIRYVVGFFIVFTIVLVTVTTMSKSVSWLINSIGLKGPDSILGVLFGGLRGILFIVLFILLAKLSTFSNAEAWRTSVLIPYFEPLEAWLAELIPYDFQ